MANLKVSGNIEIAEGDGYKRITSLSNGTLIGTGTTSLTQTITFSQPISNFKFLVVGVNVYNKTLGYECYCIPVAIATLQTWFCGQDGASNPYQGKWDISETELSYTNIAGGRSEGGIIIYGIK